LRRVKGPMWGGRGQERVMGVNMAKVHYTRVKCDNGTNDFVQYMLTNISKTKIYENFVNRSIFIL
jgi:hypothetical protein